MRDILSKLDSIISETALNPNNPEGDYEAKKQALQDLENDPVASTDPEISKAIAQRKQDLDKEAKVAGIFEVGDEFGISFSEDFEIGTSIVDIVEDGIVISLDETALNYLSQQGFTFEEGELTESVAGPEKCWKGYRKVGTKPGTGKNAGKRVNDCEKIGEGLDMNLLKAAQGAMKSVKKDSESDRNSHKPYGYRDDDSDPDESPRNDKFNKSRWKKHSILDKEVDEFFFYDVPEKKDRGPRDHGHDELARREKTMGKGGLAKDARDYKEKDKYGDAYKIKGPKGKLPEDTVDEAEYQGRDVPLGKPMKGDVKKSKVYVKNPQGNVVKVNFGDKKMRIKKSNPARKKSFRARHNCDNPGPRHKARYWSCRAW
jgi:hypothetical protein